MKVKCLQNRPKIMPTGLRLLTALMLVLSVFIFPITVSAAEPSNVTITTTSQANTNVAPPTVFAEINGALMRIEAISGFYPVEAVFINERRFNFRVDSALVVDISSYIATEDTIAVYAVDFAGNVSNTVLLTPPLMDSFLPPPVHNNPFTPDGQATVLDRATDEDGKEFFTFVTPAGNTFHLIVDSQRGANNVYFLNAVTEFDLMTLAEASGVNMPNHSVSGIPAPPPLETENEPQPPTPEEPPAQSGGMDAGTIFFLIVIFAAVGGAGYYFKILRPRHQEQMMDDDEYEDNEEYDDDNEEDVEENLDSDDSRDTEDLEE